MNTLGAFKYYHIAKINFKNSFAYIYDSIATAIFIGIIIFIFSNIWIVIFKMNPNGLVNGFTLQMMVWYLVMTEAIVVAQGKIAIEIGKEVVSGEIANYLNKPYEYMLYKYFSTIGASIATFSLIIIAGGIAASIMVGPLQISLTTIPFILFSSLLGITLNFIMMYTLGIFALWMEDSKALDFIYQKLLFTVGGMLAPLDIFPAWFSSISILLPFSYVAYAPAKLFVSFTFEKFIQIIPIQIFWIIVTFLAATLVFKILSRRVSINGG